MTDLRLTLPPSTDVGMVIRRPPADVFQAIVDPATTTKFWYTKSSGTMRTGADLTWESEMYGVSSIVSVLDVRRTGSSVHMDCLFARATHDGQDPLLPFEIDSPTRVAFTWGFVEPQIGVTPGSSTVEVTVEPVDGGRVRLVHCGLPRAEVEEHAKGWTEMLEGLAIAASEHDTD